MNKELYQDYINGLSISELANKYKVSKTRVYKDIAECSKEQEKFIDIIKRKGMFISAKELNTINTYEDYKDFINVRKLEQELMMHITPTLIDWNVLESTAFYTEKEFNIVKELVR